jgi:hypothetical protein
MGLNLFLQIVANEALVLLQSSGFEQVGGLNSFDVCGNLLCKWRMM